MDILRILAATGVIILHLNSFSVGGILSSAKFASINSNLAYFGESVFIGSVNIFLIISGYFLGGRQSDKYKIRLSKIFELIIEVSTLQVASYLVYFLIGKGTFSLAGFVTHILPTNYYIVLYVALYLFSPFINYAVDRLYNCKKLKIFLLVFLLVFDLYPFIVGGVESYFNLSLSGLSTIGIEGDMGGYTIVHFLGMYLIGITIRKYNIKLKQYFVFLLIMLWGGITIWKLLEDYYGANSIVLYYNNPFIVGSAVLSFLLFANLNVKPNRIISMVAKASLMVYLIQGYIIHVINAVDYANAATWLLLIRVVVVILLIWVVAIPISIIINHFFSIINETKIVKMINIMGKRFCLEDK